MDFIPTQHLNHAKSIRAIALHHYENAMKLHVARRRNLSNSETQSIPAFIYEDRFDSDSVWEMGSACDI